MPPGTCGADADETGNDARGMRKHARTKANNFI
jgi:hypothetical protein